jgi:hypothetical protein
MEVAEAGLNCMRLTASFRQLGAAGVGAALGLGTSASAAVATNTEQISAQSGEARPQTSAEREPAGAPDASDALSFSSPAEAGRDSTDDQPNVNQASPPVARIHIALGPQWFWVSQKTMTGAMLRAGRGRWSGAFEASLIFDTDVRSRDARRPEQDSAFLGAQFGGYVMASPIQNQRFELSLGAGVDYYRLWGIHASAWELALAARATAHLRLVAGFGVFASARVYPLSSSGLELGTYRNGERGLPVLFSTGIEWRVQ